MENKPEWKKTGETLEGKEILKRSLNLTNLTAERGIANKSVNRNSIYQSLERWLSVRITRINNNDLITKTRYIFEIKTDNKKQNVELLVNARFFDFCCNKGITIILDWLFIYKFSTSILLDVFLQSTKWEQYKEELLFERCGINETNLKKIDKRKILRKTFKEINKFGDQIKASAG